MPVLTPRLLLSSAVVLCLAQYLLFPRVRWVEDESWYSIPAATLLREGKIRNPTFPPQDLESHVDMRPPAMPLAMAAVFRLAGVGPVQARLLSWLAATAAILLTARFAAYLAGPWAGALAALLLSVDNFLLLAARTARPEAPVVASGLAALLVPLRLHIAIIIVASFAVLWFVHRPHFRLLSILTLPHLLLWLYLVNKSSRYLALLSPVFASAVALAAFYLIKRGLRCRLVALLACAVWFFRQLLGNLWFLDRARFADYPAVVAQLRSLIPAGHSVYGSIVFGMGLRDRPYFSYDRTPLTYAVNVARVEYLILYDRVMARGSGYGQDEFANLRADAARLVAQRGSLVGRVANTFYGQLEVWRLERTARLP